MKLDILKHKYVELGQCIDEFSATDLSYEDIFNHVLAETKMALMNAADDDTYAVLLYKLIRDAESANNSIYTKILINRHIDACLESLKWAKTREEIKKIAEEYLERNANETK